MKKLTIEQMNRLSQEEFLQAQKIPLVIVLDNIRSQHNIGAVFRTADAFRIQKIYLCGCSATPPNQEIHKTALGAEQTVSWEYCQHTETAVEQLKKQGYNIFAVEQAQGSTPLHQFTISTQLNKIAIILGHEVFGVQQQVIDLCNQCIEIPQYGTKHSLNVSVAAGIVIYHIAQQLWNCLNN